mmetsp:Transcript_4146/g.12970  ORF Transcript_4146/g.12970 Transcript_4146/m.12970 type:complete len:225 (+) Transcript_4146:244-918(+)
MSNRDWTTMTWKPPPPWETVMDPGSGRPFYHNTVTGEKTWNAGKTCDTSEMGVILPQSQDVNVIANAIPMPDRDKEPEKYAAWENLTKHIRAGGEGGDSMCGDFQNGRCTRGAMCKFSHGEDNPTRFNNAAQTDSRGVNMCNDWARGDCFRGARCKFSHGEDNPTLGTGDPRAIQQGPVNPSFQGDPRGGGGYGGDRGGGGGYAPPYGGRHDDRGGYGGGGGRY